MGSPTTEYGRESDEVQHEVTLSAFKMSKYEITNAQYAAFLNANGVGSDGFYAAGAYPSQVLIYAISGSNAWGLYYTSGQWVSPSGLDDHPVVNVTWYGAAEFAIYAGSSLPTEAQWEYACRAGTSSPFSTGDCLGSTQANYMWLEPYNTCTNSNTTPFPGRHQAVGIYSPNAYGLYDMHGNVWEWCSDWWGTYAAPLTNPTGPAYGSNRVIRGGGWFSDAQACRSASRISNSPAFYVTELGFRLVFPQ